MPIGLLKILFKEFPLLQIVDTTFTDFDHTINFFLLKNLLL